MRRDATRSNALKLQAPGRFFLDGVTLLSPSRFSFLFTSSPSVRFCPVSVSFGQYGEWEARTLLGQGASRHTRHVSTVLLVVSVTDAT